MTVQNNQDARYTKKKRNLSMLSGDYYWSVWTWSVLDVIFKTIMNREKLRSAKNEKKQI